MYNNKRVQGQEGVRLNLLSDLLLTHWPMGICMQGDEGQEESQIFWDIALGTDIHDSSKPCPLVVLCGKHYDFYGPASPAFAVKWQASWHLVKLFSLFRSTATMKQTLGETATT